MPAITQRIVLLAGGNHGLGRAVVETFAADGVDVILTFRSQAEEVKDVVEAVAALGRRAEALQLDTMKTASFPAFAVTLRETLRTGWGRESFDILVNNAGFPDVTLLGATDEETVDELFAVGVYLLTQILATASEDGAPLLADQGRIVNFSSGLARVVTPQNAVHGAMKGTVEVLNRYWAVELGKRGVVVDTITPGLVATDFGGGHLRAGEEIQNSIKGATALGHVADTGDAGPTVAELVREGTGWITRLPSRTPAG